MRAGIICPPSYFLLNEGKEHMEEIKMNVNTGLAKVIIADGDIEYGYFYFNPSDFELSKRYDEVTEKLSKMELTQDATYEDILAVGEEIKRLFDYLLNYNVSDEIFKIANPFTPTQNGEFYFTNILEGVAKICKSQTQKRLAAKEEKINKALAKYKK